MQRPPPRVLTIAGSDSGGCAGVQADLKTFAALGVHGMTAVTSVTAQNTLRVINSTDLPLESIRLQIAAVVEDIGVDAVKTGMLSSGHIISLVADLLRQYRVENLVVDPVMVSSGGDRLLREEALGVLKTELLPLARIVTPNLHEAEVLSGMRIESIHDVARAAGAILEQGPGAVLIKGGHFEDRTESVDYLFDKDGRQQLRGPRVSTRHTHGSGCTLSAALAAFLARNLPLDLAAREAKAYVTAAIRHSFPLGKGSGPLGHLHPLWKTQKGE